MQSDGYSGFRLADSHSFEEFIAEFNPDDVNRVDRYGRTALQGALVNQDAEARYQIASWLLDHGADPNASWDDDGTALHCLFRNRDLDPVRDAELLRRLFDAGAKINKTSGKFGRPLTYLVQTHPGFLVKNPSNPKLAEGKVFFDIMFSRPDLDLTSRSKRTGQSYGAYVIYLAEGGFPKDLEERVRAYLVDHGEDPDKVLAPQE